MAREKNQVGKYIGNTTRPGKPIWDEYLDDKGQSTLQIHTPKTVMLSCKNWDDHVFTDPDRYGNVECRTCHLGQKVVWGIHIVKNGKIIRIAPDHIK